MQNENKHKRTLFRYNKIERFLLIRKDDGDPGVGEDNISVDR